MSYCPTCMRYVNGAVSCPGCGVLASQLEQEGPEEKQPRPPDSEFARPVRISHAGDGAIRQSHTQGWPRRKPLIVTALAAVTLTAGLAAASGLGILPGQGGARTSSTPPRPDSQDLQAGSLPYRPMTPHTPSVLTCPRPTPPGAAATQTTTPASSPSIVTGPPVAPPAGVQSTPATPSATTSPPLAAPTAPASPISSPTQTTPPPWTAQPSPSRTRHHGD
jgi:hypothetical protein